MQQSFFSNEQNEIIKISKNFFDKDLDKFSSDDTIELQRIIAIHNNLYYNEESPVISDYEYDILWKKLKKLEEKYNLIDKQSEEVGAKLSKSSFEKIPHSKPMLSLDNTYNEEDLRDFDKRINKILGIVLLKSTNSKIQYALEYKFDGLGVELVYEGGKLIKGITRGDGLIGEDITANIYEVENIPKKIDYTDKIEIRGEVVMPISEFHRINKKKTEIGEKLFSNPRNSASGSLRQLDKNITKERKLKFFAYDIPNFELQSKFPLDKEIEVDFSVEKDSQKEKSYPLLMEGFRGISDDSQKSNPGVEVDSKTYESVIEKVKSLGFETSSFFHISDIDGIIDIIEKFSKNKKNIDFEIDGLVIKVNNLSNWQILGFTGHHPRYAIAYKFPAEIISTKVENVIHSVGRTGTITPVAILSSVNIGGVVVQRATLHNYEEIEKKDIHIGDHVFIKRAGEVIPEVISVITEGRTGEELPITPPSNCPRCGEPTRKDENKVRYYCPNKSCEAQVEESISYSVGKGRLDIDGLGPRQVKLFLEKGFIKDLSDIFDLEKHKMEILKLEGYKEKSVNNLLESIKKSSTQDISIFLASLGIPGVGKRISKEISKLFKSFDDLLQFPYSSNDLEALPDIGPEISKNIIYFFDDPENKKLLNKLKNRINIFFSVQSEKNGNLSGKKICITGTFENYKRDELIQLLEQQGGEFTNTVGKNTDILLAGESAGSKLSKAQNLGTQIINIEEFIRIIGQ